MNNAVKENANDRREAVRFSLFWYLAVWNNDKAARWAFAYIKSPIAADGFPGAALYKKFIGVTGDEQDADVVEKMPFILSNQLPEPGDLGAIADWAVAPEQRELWKRVSRPGPIAGRLWNDDRLKAFQRVVEQRAVWRVSKIPRRSWL